jgi:hypothetical protein
MERTALNKIFALQSGLYCHIYKDLLVINDREFIEPRDLVMDMNKVSEVKTGKILLNAAITIAILVMTYITGFYPLALLLFLTIWDLKRIKRQTLPLLKSNCMPLNNIKSIQFITGKLGFHELDMLIVNDEGKQMQKTMRLYDSKNEIERALIILNEAGFAIENPMDAKNEKLKNAESITINENEKLYLLEKEIVIAKNNVYPQKAEYVGVNNFLFFVLMVGILASIAAKTYIIINKGQVLWVDLLVVFMFLLFLPLPFSLLNKSTSDVMQKDEILSAKIEKKRKKIFVVIESKSGWKLPLKRKVEFGSEEDAKKAVEAVLK